MSAVIASILYWLQSNCECEGQGTFSCIIIWAFTEYHKVSTTFFCQHIRISLGPTAFCSIGTWGFSRGVKWLEREADHLLLCIAEVMNLWSVTFPIPVCLNDGSAVG